MIPYCKLVVTLPPDDATEISTAAVHAARSGRRIDFGSSMVFRSAERHAVVVLCRSYTWSIGRVIRQNPADRSDIIYASMAGQGSMSPSWSVTLPLN